MAEFTKEQRDILIETAEYMVKRENTSEYSENIRKVAEIALAELTAPQLPQPAIPDEWIIQDAVKFCRDTGRQDAGAAMAGWNACRAAMLQGAEPESHAYALPANSFSNKELEGMAHGDNPQANAYRELLAFRLNSPVTPDGWQLVPKEPTEAMNKAGWAAINEHDEINPTYRAMLEAAPQHEVKK